MPSGCFCWCCALVKTRHATEKPHPPIIAFSPTVFLKYIYRKSILFLPFSKSVGFALQNSRFYRAKPTLLQCKTIGFGTPKRSCWQSVSYTRRVETIFVKIFYSVKRRCKPQFSKGRGAVHHFPNTQCSKLTATSQGYIFGAGMQQIIL